LLDNVADESQASITKIVQANQSRKGVDIPSCDEYDYPAVVPRR